jgi:hypothetical protein
VSEYQKFFQTVFVEWKTWREGKIITKEKGKITYDWNMQNYVYHQDGDVQDTLTGESLHQNSDDYNNIDDFNFKKTVAAGKD